MNARLNVQSGSRFEPEIGFSRAVRIGNHIAVSGTAPIAAGGGTAFPGDAYRQTLRCLDIIEAALKEAGATRNDIIRTRVFLTQIEFWPEVGRAHGAFFTGIQPASTFVEVSRLIEADWLVEIEADAILTG